MPDLVAQDRAMLRDGKFIVLVEQKSWEHSLFESDEDEDEGTGLNDSCDPARPTPAASVCDSTTGDETETV